MKKSMTLLSAVGALTLGVGVAGPATSAPADPDTNPSVERKAAATTKAEQQRVRDYWTPERMKNAKPRDISGKGQPQKALKGKPQPQAGGQAVQVAPQPTLGKVFFTLGGQNYVCSGTATNSGNGDVVTTAGHCLNEGPGAYATNFAFVPAYDNNNRPYGTWVAKSLLTTTQWKNSVDFNYDVGFAVMAENSSGRSLTQVVGGRQIGFDMGYRLPFESFGYPAAAPYDGQRLWKCSGTSITDTRGGSMDHGLPCSMTGGSSGGGWFTNGVLNSVNSFKYGNDNTTMWGPYFGSVVRSVYTAAAAS